MKEVIIAALCFFVAVLFLSWITSCNPNDMECLRKERMEKAAEVKREEECKKPYLVSEAEGVKLYAINYEREGVRCYGREVFFSKSGTHTTHTERHGKTTTTYDDDVSNAEAQ